MSTRREFLQDTTQGALAAWTALSFAPSAHASPRGAPSAEGVAAIPSPDPGSDIGSLYPFVQSQAVPGEFPLSFLRKEFSDVAAWKRRGRGTLLELLHYAPPPCDPRPETIERVGGVPLVNRVGHAYIKHRMREEDAVFAGEVSAHYYFRDFSQADSGVIPFLLMLELISKRGRKLSEILEQYRSRYFITGEINTPVSDVALKLSELEERFAPEGNVSHLDGISIVSDDWHFNVRPSNTEPLLRLNLEARSQELMERKRDEVLDVIRS